MATNSIPISIEKGRDKPAFFKSTRRLQWVIGLDLFEEDTTVNLTRLYVICGSLWLLTAQQFTAAFISEDIVVKTESASTGIAILNSVVKMAGVRLMIGRAREMYRTLRQLMDRPEEDDLPVLDLCERRVGLTVTTFLVLDGLAGSGAVFPPLIHNLLHPEKAVLPMKGWFPFDPESSSLVFGLSCAWLSVTTLWSAYNVGLMRITFFSSALYVSTQMSVLINHLKALDPRKEDIVQDLRRIVDLHVIVLRLAKLMNDVFAYAHLFEVILAAIQSCMQFFQVTRVHITDPRNGLYIPFLIGSVTSLFLICFAGELLKSKSEKIMEAAYDVPWHEMSPQVRREFLCILRQSSRTLTLNVRGHFVMDMVLFLRTMQSAYTYMTILTSME